MSSLWLVLLTMGAAPNPAPQPLDAVAVEKVAEPAAATAGPVPDLQQVVRQALRRWARPDDTVAETAAREFLLLYRLLQRDEGLSSRRREELRLKVRSRLIQLGNRIAHGLDRKDTAEKQGLPATVDLPAERPEFLAQLAGRGPRAAGFVGGGRRAAAGLEGMVTARGAQLVELIQATIAPDSWEVNGGPGSIYFWAPGRALGVRQTQRTHEDLGDVLRQLRRAGE